MCSITRFDCRDTFEHALLSGVSLFCGAGFSVAAQDKQGQGLPSGPALLDELKKAFPDIATQSKLDKAAGMLEKRRKQEFYDFLYKRFTIGDYDEVYSVLPRLKWNGIYTTNIDDLVLRIFHDSKENVRLNDCSIRGIDSQCNGVVNYYPLHGCVAHEEERFVFSTTGIASAFSDRGKQDFWQHLRWDAQTQPMLFCGWNFEDAGPLEAMYGADSETDHNTNRWVLIYQADENSGDNIDYLTAMGYNIIVGDTESLLGYFRDVLNNNQLKSKSIQSIKYSSQMSDYMIPPNDNKLPRYDFKEFFTEYAPQWSHIYSGQIVKTRWYREIENTIYAGKNRIVYGVRGAGKTTLMMQLLVGAHVNKEKYFLQAPTCEEVTVFLRLLKQRSALVMVDDCFRDTKALELLCRQKGVQVIAFDRDFSFESQYASLEQQYFEQPVDVTVISLEDAQNIVNTIPNQILYRNRNGGHNYFPDDLTIPGLLSSEIKHIGYGFLKKYYNEDPISAELFLVVCYVHSCGSGCSFDMIYSYLGDENYSWQEMLEIVGRFGHLVQEDLHILQQDESQSYYICRSRFFAEKIINYAAHAEKELLAKVLLRFTERVPVYKIYAYDRFRRYAYDGGRMGEVFGNIEQGRKFYELCVVKERNEYIYQQAAIYFSHKKAYQQAFAWIDKARNLTHYNVFSIQSTHAKISFDVNLPSDKSKALDALRSLGDCCRKDRRKAIHFDLFSSCVLRYLEKYSDTEEKELVEEALGYVHEGLDEKNFALSPRKKKHLRKNEVELKHWAEKWQ